MSDWNIGRVFRVAVSAVVSYYTNNWSYFLAQVSREGGNAEASRKNRRALERYNSSLQNRLEMVDLQPNAARTLVLGRVRYVEGVRDRWTSGALDEKLTLIVSFAGHEIDGFEQWFLDENPVAVDGSGYVTTAPYATTTTEPTAAGGTLDGSGNGAVTLTGWYTGGVAPYATWSTGDGDNRVQGSATVTMAGSVATVSGGQPGAVFNVGYETQSVTSYVRIRPFLGAAGQNVGAALAAEYPGKITADDEFAGIALAVVDVFYSPDVFPQGRPNVTATLRGAKCYDPRTGSTSWTQNPALHALKYATWVHGWALQASDYMAADVAAAATACDVSTVFTMRDPAGTTSAVTLPRYRCDIAIGSDVDHEQAMASILQTMAGRSAWAGGVWRLRAGGMASPVATITQAWLFSEAKGGQADDAPVISAVQSIPRVQRINRVTGSCVDPDQRYQVLPFPAVQDAVLIARDGERPVEVEMAGVTHIAHAQHLASIAIRQAHAGLQLELVCGLDAEDLELLDVVALDMPRYGFSGKTFEVVGWRWAQMGAYRLQLAEITNAIFDPLAELTGRDPAPDSDLRQPWDVPALGTITVVSGTGAIADGSTITRTRISWAAVQAASVRTGGQVEVQYAVQGPAAPQWSTWPEPGTETSAVIPGLLAGVYYLFRARAVQTLPLVRGVWSPVVLHQVGRAAQDALQAQLAAALDAADAAQATADGKIDTFWQSSEPGSASEGDLWFDTDDGFKQYRRTGGAWVLAADTRIGQAISDAADAQATADGKVTTFVSAAEPTAEAIGDLWLDSDDGNRLARWSGTAWVALPVGTGGLAPGAASTVSTDDNDFAGATFGTSTARTVVVTPAVDCNIEFTASLFATNVIGDAGNQVGWYVTPAGGSEVPLGGAGVSTTAKQQITSATAFAATGGVALTFAIKVTRPTGNPSIGLFASQMRITQIKR